MSENPDDKNNGNSFEYRLKEVSNEEIISILRFRDHYQKHAVNAAIKEALKRGLISSIEDLEKEEFQPQELSPKSLFPIGNSEMQTVAIFKSLCRILYGFGIIPIIFGILQFTYHKILLGNVFLFTGAIILFIVIRLEKTQKQLFAQLMLVVNIPAILFAVLKLIKLGHPQLMDIFAGSLLVLVLLYTTIYVNKLVSILNKSN